LGLKWDSPEWNDQQEVLRYLHATKQSAFFTRDLGFFRRRFCHPNYFSGSSAMTSLKLMHETA